MVLREIVPRLYVSGHTRKSSYIENFIKLQNAGITAVLCVAPRKDPPLEAEMLSHGLDYRHLPMSDGVAVPPTANEAAELVLKWSREGKSILIHCNAGRNRSCFIAALSLLKAKSHFPQDVKPLDIIEYIRARRPNALANMTFVNYLMEQKRD